MGSVGGLRDGELLAIFRGQPRDAAETAFATIVKRHGPMVHRVCSQVLGNSHDADDAFQATFLVLIHKASLLTLSDSLGPWLHGVALRVASCARKANTLRLAHEHRAGQQRMQCADEGRWDDLAAVLHEEIHRLPEHYRTTVVLCWLEGMSTEAASHRLRCPQGTVLSRLSRARERLRKRLARRGVTLAGGALGTAFFAEEASAAMAEALIDSTIRAASHVLSRNGAGAVSAEVSTLTKQVLTTMMLTKVKMSAAVLLSIGTLMAGAGVLARQETAPSRAARAQPAAPTSALPASPDEPQATADRVGMEFGAASEEYMRQIRQAVAVLGRQSNARNDELTAIFREKLNQVELEVKKAQARLAGSAEPDPAQSPSDGTGEIIGPNPKPKPKAMSKARSSIPTQASDDARSTRARGPHTDQPTLRAGGYIFTASPTGNKAIAYNPTTREIKSVQLNATKEHPLKITPMTGNFVHLVALRIEGLEITRVAVFDLDADKWLPIDLNEPGKGDVNPVYLGHGGTAYDLGRHVYTFNARAKAWDHVDITTFSDDDVEDKGAAKVSAEGRASK